MAEPELDGGQAESPHSAFCSVAVIRIQPGALSQSHWNVTENAAQDKVSGPKSRINFQVKLRGCLGSSGQDRPAGCVSESPLGNHPHRKLGILLGSFSKALVYSVRPNSIAVGRPPGQRSCLSFHKEAFLIRVPLRRLQNKPSLSSPRLDSFN